MEYTVYIRYMGKERPMGVVCWYGVADECSAYGSGFALIVCWWLLKIESEQEDMKYIENLHLLIFLIFNSCELSLPTLTANLKS